MTNPLKTLTQNGVSIWLDDLSRERIQSGNLAKMISEYSVRGVTTNPTIFAAALKGASYHEAIASEAMAGHDASTAIANITSSDVAAACDIFLEVYEQSNGVDGRVSIEVEPKLAHDAKGTIKQALELYELVGRENVMIKIPATKAGLEAIEAVTAAGISVNVTLIFSTLRYNQVIDAYFAGLKKAHSEGKNLAKIHSVASFFVSRVDTEVDKRLEALGREELKSQAALANARLAYQLFLDRFSSADWQKLSDLGARLQRPLMASTGVKDPTLDDTLYVTQLVSPDLVNTMPEKTMMATFEHGIIPDDSIRNQVESAVAFMKKLSDAGVDFDDVTELLEKEGVEKFIVSWDELVATVEQALKESN
ncbi:transaldolase [Candidatus Aquiluna sp. UB-MaderosW2red]|jgi:transaldolase|uniref:transaldolase n=1 Tax=Candidatus Aquiluna sp. UB-MaderosW2red TaxID=1855377 RepID=UPI000875B825|nr:transaldolase [Candidatus Aquiluna sp. UB-MaderosW2red]SCX12063.1 transaldolase [Candidatus Aquiluna sp. UB-MaderosW2red]